jgi:hypothetical protein
VSLMTSIVPIVAISVVLTTIIHNKQTKVIRHLHR